MAIERTLCIIKPDAVEKRKAGAILQHLLEEGFNVLGLRQVQLSPVRHILRVNMISAERTLQKQATISYGTTKVKARRPGGTGPA